MSEHVSPSATERQTAVANKLLAESSVKTDRVDVETAVEDARVAVSALTAVAQAAAEKVAETREHQRRGTLPEKGANTVIGEVRTDAERLAGDAERAFRESIATAENAVVESAIPSLKSDTERLMARDHLGLVLGDAEGGEASARFRAAVANGNAEVAALLGSDRTYLESKLRAAKVGNIGDLVADARKTAAQSNEKSAEALAKLEKLKAARTAARLGVEHAFGQ